MSSTRPTHAIYILRLSIVDKACLPLADYSRWKASTTANSLTELHLPLNLQQFKKNLSRTCEATYPHSLPSYHHLYRSWDGLQSWPMTSILPSELSFWFAEVVHIYSLTSVSFVVSWQQYCNLPFPVLSIQLPGLLHAGSMHPSASRSTTPTSISSASTL